MPVIYTKKKKRNGSYLFKILLIVYTKIYMSIIRNGAILMLSIEFALPK